MTLHNNLKNKGNWQPETTWNSYKCQVASSLHVYYKLKSVANLGKHTTKENKEINIK